MQKSYVVIARSGSTYEYMATIVENFDGDTRGVPLTSRSDLNKENARTRVEKGDDLEIVNPTVGTNLNGYTVTNIIDS